MKIAVIGCGAIGHVATLERVLAIQHKIEIVEKKTASKDLKAHYLVSELKPFIIEAMRVENLPVLKSKFHK